MNLSVEIKDNKLLFSYEVGTSKFSSTSDLTPEGLVSFTHLLELGIRASHYTSKEWEDEMRAKAYLEKKK